MSPRGMNAGEYGGLIMDNNRRLIVSSFLEQDFSEQMRDEVRAGLSGPDKSIPCKYLYDVYGSRLFDEICWTPEYYPTRVESGILEVCAPVIMRFFSGEGGDLVEIGSGSERKIRKLLMALPRQCLRGLRYVPLDIDEAGILRSARCLAKGFPELRIHGIRCDFTRHLHHLPRTRKLIVFLGGTFGNLARDAGVKLLEELARAMTADDRLLIGLDTVKPPPVIEAAYNDASGITRRFNLNILSHVNRMLGADFRTGDFEHLAFYDQERRQVEMHLLARKDLKVRVADLDLEVELERGQSIHTETSRKFTHATAEGLFSEAGLQAIEWYADRQAWFFLVELRRAPWYRGHAWSSAL